MNERESQQAANEARRDLASTADQPARHEDGLVRFLAGMAYEESRERRATKRDAEVSE